MIDYLPTIREGLAKGTPIEPNDPFWGDLNVIAKRAKTEPMKWLSIRQIYGDLSQETRFADAFCKWLSVIWADGIEAAINQYSAD